MVAHTYTAIRWEAEVAELLSIRLTLDCIINIRPIWATQRNLVSNNNDNGKIINSYI